MANEGGCPGTRVLPDRYACVEVQVIGVAGMEVSGPKEGGRDVAWRWSEMDPVVSGGPFRF